MPCFRLLETPDSCHSMSCHSMSCHFLWLVMTCSARVGIANHRWAHAQWLRLHMRIQALRSQWKSGRMAGWKFVYNGSMEWPFSASVYTKHHELGLEIHAPSTQCQPRVGVCTLFFFSSQLFYSRILFFPPNGNCLLFFSWLKDRFLPRRVSINFAFPHAGLK